jgi:hypothetical protein
MENYQAHLSKDKETNMALLRGESSNPKPKPISSGAPMFLRYTEGMEGSLKQARSTAATNARGKIESSKSKLAGHKNST